MALKNLVNSGSNSSKPVSPKVEPEKFTEKPPVIKNEPPKEETPVKGLETEEILQSLGKPNIPIDILDMDSEQFEENAKLILLADDSDEV